MGCLGVHFALTSADVAALRAAETDDERLEHLQEEIEETLGVSGDHAVETDKSWDAMHRALSDGTLTWDGGAYPLNHVVLGGELLYSGDDYIMSLKSPPQVADIARAIVSLSEAEFRIRYDLIDANAYDGELGDEDFSYTWENFQAVREFYTRAAADGRFVLFTADQ